MFTLITYANMPGVAIAQSFVAKFNAVILFPIITLLIAVAVLVFIWGSFQYIINATNPTARADGQKHIMWGIVGLLVMLSAYAILTVAANTFGLKERLDCVDDPSGVGCARLLDPENYLPPTCTTHPC